MCSIYIKVTYCLLANKMGINSTFIFLSSIQDALTTAFCHLWVVFMDELWVRARFLLLSTFHNM